MPRVATLLVFTLAIGGCGFRPLYAPLPADASVADRAVADDLASVRVATILDRPGQELRNRLQGLLRMPGAAGSPGKYVLNVALNEFQQSLAVRQTGLATRANLYMTATYNMIDSSTGGPVLGGSSVAIASYDLLDQDFATLTAINDARSRVVERIAGDIRNRLAVHFSTASTATATPAPAAGAPVGPPAMTPPVVLVPSPATEPTIASPGGTPIDLPSPESGLADPLGGSSSAAPVGPAVTRPGVGGLP